MKRLQKRGERHAKLQLNAEVREQRPCGKMTAYGDLLVETPAFKQPLTFRSLRLSVPEPELSGQAFDLQTADTGGAAYLASNLTGDGDRVLLWEFTEEVR